MLPGVHDPLVVTERRQGADHRRGLHEVRPGPEHVRDGCAHRILSVHLNPLPSAAVTTSISPRALTLAASIGWRHVTADPVRALLLAWRGCCGVRGTGPRRLPSWPDPRGARRSSPWLPTSPPPRQRPWPGSRTPIPPVPS